MADSEPKNDRDKFNRMMGLGAYAAGALALVGTVFAAIETFQSKKPEYGTLAIVAGATVIFFGIGYSTGRRK